MLMKRFMHFTLIFILVAGYVADSTLTAASAQPGMPVTDYVSTKSFLVLRRETPNGVAESYGDFRTVDGTVLPFRIEMRVPGLGNIVYGVKDIKFDVAVADSVFRARKKSER